MTNAAPRRPGLHLAVGSSAATIFTGPARVSIPSSRSVRLPKTDVLLEDGHDQVTGFQIAGELLGLDGINAEHHTCNAIALEDSEVCSIPFLPVWKAFRAILQHHFHKVMSRISSATTAS